MNEPLIAGAPTDAALSDQLLSTAWTPRGNGWLVWLGLAAAGTMLLAIAATYTVVTGIGVWGTTIPIGWAFAIVNFVWWIGIGHAGTFISAILLLFEQRWRTSINRFAEAMTLFAVMQAGLFPVLHLGRPWFAYWLVPYPARMRLWPNFHSALPWDAAAVFTYFTVSLAFWYLGLIPDLAAARDRAPSRTRATIYGVFALGWRGSAEQQRHYRTLYIILAGLATPLVLSVHSIVSSDFATGIVPGWHSTIFPPFFVAGAIFSGFAMVLTLIIPARRVFQVENVITLRHLDAMAKLLLVTGWIVTYSYLVEDFLAWWGGESAEAYQLLVARTTGPHAAVFWTSIVCNCVVIQLLWWPRVRRSPIALWIIAGFVQVGMWCERFVIVVQSLQRDYLPSQWRTYHPTWVDWSILGGTIGFFLLLFLVFLRLVPFVPVMEVKELADEQRRQREAHA
jgi:molybdopterin-containing oxidoreductase family membrane subunit